MADINDFTQTFLGVQDLLLRRRAQESAEAAQQVAGLVSVTDVAERIAAGDERAGLVGFLAQRTGMSPFDARRVVEAVAPAAGVTERTEAQQGVEVMEPDARQQAQRIAGTRAASGGLTPSQMGIEQVMQTVVEEGTEALKDPEFRAGLAKNFLTRQFSQLPFGDFNVQMALGALPDEDFERIAKINSGLELSEVQREQIAAAAADNRLAWERLAVQAGIAMQDLDLEWNKFRAAMRQGVLGQLENPTPLFGHQARIVDMLTREGDKTDHELVSLAAALNTVNWTLQQNGFPVGPPLPEDADAIRGWRSLDPRRAFGPRGAVPGEQTWEQWLAEKQGQQRTIHTAPRTKR